MIHAADLMTPIARLVPDAFFADVDTGPKPERSEALADARDACEKAILERAGLDPGLSVQHGPHGEPRFPDGTVGCFSTKCTRVVAVAARAEDVLGVGIDVERVDQHDDELRALLNGADVPAMPSSLAAALTFAAQEAVFKAQFHVTGQYLDFGSVKLDWDVSANRFAARVRPARGSPVSLEGRFVVDEPWVLAFAAVRKKVS